MGIGLTDTLPPGAAFPTRRFWQERLRRQEKERRSSCCALRDQPRGAWDGFSLFFPPLPFIHGHSLLQELLEAADFEQEILDVHGVELVVGVAQGLVNEQVHGGGACGEGWERWERWECWEWWE